MRMPATATHDIDVWREAADRWTRTGASLVSADLVKGTRYGAACRIVHRDRDSDRTIVSQLFAVGDRDTLYFICWSRGSRDELSPDCQSTFDSIVLED